MGEPLRMTLAPMRLVPPPVSGPLPLPVLISVIEERVTAVKQGATAIGCLTELLEQALSHLKEKHRLESSSVL